MSDDSQNENENTPENESAAENEQTPEVNPNDIDIDALVGDVAAGVEDASEDGVSEESNGDEAVTDEWAAAMAEDPTTEEAGNVDDGWGDAMAEEADSIKQAKLDPLTDEGQSGSDHLTPELDVILDIPVSISMEVGRTEIPIRNLLQLNQGSVVELDRLAGEPLDVLVNGTLIAHGEVVMVNDKFGIRLTDVVSQSERIQRLR
ncbi:Flagellar motor switch protein FliN [Oleispira antarctica RB-8]|uniref:Flagellar motor switch protein FliN n=1 Tax=Oleispira antarctica RB-8 TaxID=698738 RepID=R4YQ83_OLEAN|nr:Flagellar motor switch protein FliN [Oleispira antarctica RB-8]|tara:strand:- start:3351 stop:3962 length:612 start_codon:yes stop_codon:yes gene_type:complete